MTYCGFSDPREKARETNAVWVRLPATATKINNSPWLNWIEQWISNPLVTGSSPVGEARIRKGNK